MIDIEIIRQDPDLVQYSADNKKIKVDIKRFLQLDEKRKEYAKKVDDLRHARNVASKEIPKLQGEEKQTKIAENKKLKSDLEELEKQLNEILADYNKVLMTIPSIPLEGVPVGKDDDDNVEVRKVGDIVEFPFKPKDHVELGELLDIIDIPSGVKLAGTRNYVLKNEGALLEHAVCKFTLDFLISKGFTPYIVPFLVKDAMMYGTGYFPGGEEQAYRCERDELNLIGTSEVPLVGIFQGKTLTEAELPVKSTALSYCFRREAGTYGKDTKGLYRIHQFQKVEQVVICKNDDEASMKIHEELLNNSEEIVKALGLPYRVVTVCTGEMGMGQVYKHDIETYMPSRKGYGETHSCSSFHEFQARRLNIRYKDSNNRKVFAHTLNNTAIASPRILIPLLELNQQEDGSVKIPEVLQPYMNGITEIKPKKK